MKGIWRPIWIISVVFGLGFLTWGTKLEAAEKIKIGVFGPMSFLQGEHAWYGASIAAEEINQEGGVQLGKEKRPIELIKVETNELVSIPDATLAIERAITVDKVDFLVGGYRSEAAIAMQEIAANYRKIFVVPPCGHPEVVKRIKTDYEKYKYVFRVGGSSVNGIKLTWPHLKHVGDTIKKELGIEKPKVAILAVKVMWPTPFITLVKKLSPSEGMEIVGEWRPSPKATDLTAELTGIKAAGAHIIFTCLGGPVNVVYGRQWGELEIPAASVGYAVETSGLSYWKNTGGKANYEATGGLFARVESTPRAVPFYDKFVKISKGDSPTQSAATYDGVWVIKEAVEKAGTLDSDHVVAEMEKTDFLGSAARIVFTGKDAGEPHDVKFGPGLTTGFGLQWQDGELVCFWPPVDGSYHGIVYKGTRPYKLPPRVTQYWKGKK